MKIGIKYGLKIVLLVAAFGHGLNGQMPFDLRQKLLTGIAGENGTLQDTATFAFGRMIVTRVSGGRLSS